jgi:hypothetical protein
MERLTTSQIVGMPGSTLRWKFSRIARHPYAFSRIKNHSVKSGDIMSLINVLENVFLQRTGEQFPVGSVYACSCGAMEATDTSFLGVFYVG